MQILPVWVPILPQRQNKEHSEIWKILWTGHRKCQSLYCWIHSGPRGLAAWAVKIFGSRKSSLEKEVFRSLIFGKFLPSLTKHTLGFTSFLNSSSIQGTLGVCGFRSSPRKRYLESLRFSPPPTRFLGSLWFSCLLRINVWVESTYSQLYTYNYVSIMLYYIFNIYNMYTLYIKPNNYQYIYQ